jgi:hypothetical protein
MHAVNAGGAGYRYRRASRRQGKQAPKQMEIMDATSRNRTFIAGLLYDVTVSVDVTVSAEERSPAIEREK